MKRLAVFALATLLVGCGVGATSDPGTEDQAISPGATVSTTPPLPVLDPNEIALGKAMYDLHCSECHGADLKGEADWRQQNEDGTFRAPPHDASGHTWHHSDRLLLEAVKLGGQRYSANIGGTSTMPAYEDVLTESEITAVLTYIKSHWPDDLRTVQWQVTVMDTQ